MNKADREHFIREQQAKIRPETVTEAPLFTQAEFERYQQETQRIHEENPDLLTPENANNLASAGYDFHKEVGAKIIRDGAADVTAYLNSDRGQAARCDLLNVIHSKEKSLAVYERIKSEVRRNGLYQRPVWVRTGNEGTDEYLIERRRDIMHGIRRTR